jgi:hypothetical protein
MSVLSKSTAMRYLLDIRRLAFALLLPAVVTLLTAEASRELPTAQDRSDMVVGELSPGTAVGQVFTADQAGVYRIDLMLSTYARHNTGVVVFHVRPAPTAATDWVTLRLDAATVVDNAYHAFEFPPLPNKRGDKLYFFVEAVQSSPGNAVTVAAESQDVYAGGPAVVIGPPDTRAKDLRFRVYYQPNVAQALGGLLDRLAAGRPGFLGSPVCYVILAIAYLLLLFGLGWRLFAVWIAG